LIKCLNMYLKITWEIDKLTIIQESFNFHFLVSDTLSWTSVTKDVEDTNNTIILL